LGFSLYGMIDEANTSNIFMDRRKMLAHMCGRIEQDVVNARLDADVFAGFQKYVYVTPVIERYQSMVDQGAQVWLFAEGDSGDVALDGVLATGLLAGDALLREWFLVVSHPEYARALVAQEVTPDGTPQRERLFRGVMTSDPVEVARFAAALKQEARERALSV
jgi:DICT domain-containing protein